MAAGDLDPSFGIDGIAEYTFVSHPDDDEVGTATIIQPDGKILVAANDAVLRFNADGSPDFDFGVGGQIDAPGAEGLAIDANGNIFVAGSAENNLFVGNRQIVVAKFKSDGSHDHSWSDDGLAYSVGGRGEELALQPDGKVVVVATDFTVLRFNTDGNLDPTFDGDGIVTTSFGATSQTATDVAIQSNGRIVVVGYKANIAHDIAVARFNGDGSPDQSFGPNGDGQVTTVIGTGESLGLGVALQADGRIVVAADTYQFPQTPNKFTLVRYTTDGALDPAFGSAGVVQTSIDNGGGGDIPFALSVQADGKILVGGVNAYSRFALARYTSSGALETSFDGDGKVTTAFSVVPGEEALSQVHAIAISGSRIVAVGAVQIPKFEGAFGISEIPANFDVAIAAYHLSNGALDTSFDQDGKLTTYIATGGAGVRRAALQADGKIVLVSEISAIGLMRMNADGSLDIGFGDNGKVLDSVGLIGGIAAVAFQGDAADQKILLAGGDAAGSIIVRYNSDGSLDASFGAQGVVRDYDLSGEPFTSLVVQDDQKIVVCKNGSTPTSPLFELQRYLPNGALDTDFGVDGYAVCEGLFPTALALQHGKIVVAGADVATGGMLVARFTADGILDQQFAGDGTAVVPESPVALLSPLNVIVQADDKVAIGGIVGNSFNSLRFKLIRFDSTGSLDTAFQQDPFDFGGFYTAPGGFPETSGFSLAQLPDGKLIVAGASTNPITGDADSLLIRYDMSGELDTTFRGTGVLIADVGDAKNRFDDVIVMPDGRVLAVGYAMEPSLDLHRSRVSLAMKFLMEDEPQGSFVVTPTSGLSVNESGGAASFQVSLSTQPTSDVTISVASSDTTEVTVGVTQLIFTTANWSDPQTVVVTGVDDRLLDGDVGFTITLGAAVSTDPAYSGIDPDDVTGMSLDDESPPAIQLTPPGGLETTENGAVLATGAVAVKLLTAPLEDVVIPLSSSNTNEMQVYDNFGNQITSLTFTTADWHINQIIVARGVDDAVDDGDQPFTLVLGPAQSDDPLYDGFDPDDVTGTNLDDDAPANQFTITGTNGPDTIVLTQGAADGQFAATLNGVSLGAFVLGPDESIGVDGLEGADILRVNGRAAADEIAVNETGFVVNGTVIDVVSIEDRRVFGLDGNDHFRIISSPAVAIDGGKGIDTIVGGDADNQWRLTASNAGNLNELVAFIGVESLTGGFLTDRFRFQGAASGVTGKIDGAEGLDTLDYSDASRAVTVDFGKSTATGTKGIVGIDSVIGGDLVDTVIAPNTDNFWRLDRADAINDINGIYTFSGVENLTGGALTDQFQFVVDWEAPLPLSARFNFINGSGGADTLDYSPLEHSIEVDLALATAPALASFAAVEAIVGSGTSDILRGPNANTTWNLDGWNSGSVGKVRFFGFENLVGARLNDSFKLAVEAFINGQIDGGAGIDMLTALDFENVWTLTGFQSGDLNGQLFSGIENLTGGKLNDNFVFATEADGFGVVAGRSGTDTLNFGAGDGPVAVDLAASTATKLANFSAIESLIGSAGVDTLRGFEAATTWTITGIDAGTVGKIPFTDFENLTGGSFDDVFQVRQGASVTGVLDGGDGYNVLDYSFFGTGGVNVDLNAQTATATGGVSSFTFAIGSDGADTLIGDSRANVLLGGAGIDALFGGDGRDLLIGGAAADVLHGGLGQDILYGGTTSYYNAAKKLNLTALKEILDEWASGDESTYFTRKHRLNSAVLGFLTPPIRAATFTNDGAIDLLFGHEDRDWFIVRAGDSANDREADEAVTDL